MNNEEKYIDKDIVERRMVSYCIDSLFIWITVYFIQNGYELLNGIEPLEIIKIWYTFCIVIDIIYHCICYLIFNTTIAGFICNIKLVDKNNQKLTNLKKLERVILKIITKYFVFGILLLPTCFDKIDTWYDKRLGINLILNKSEDEELKRMILSLKFNCALNGGIVGILMMIILLIRLIFFGGYGIIELLIMSGYFIIKILINILIFIIFLNILSYPFREIYIENSLKKDRVENIDIDERIELEVLNKKNLDVIRNGELDILNENKKLEKSKKNIINDRASAFYMDSIIKFFIFLIIIVVIRLEYDWFAVILLLDIIYYFLCNLIFSTTIGGLVFQIITVNKEGKKLTIIENVLRSTMKECSKLLLFIPFLYTYMLDEEMWYDKILKTRVISKEEYKNR